MTSTDWIKLLEYAKNTENPVLLFIGGVVTFFSVLFVWRKFRTSEYVSAGDALIKQYKLAHDTIREDYIALEEKYMKLKESYDDLFRNKISNKGEDE